MKKNTMQTAYRSVEQTYYVRRYFRGSKDFERAMERLAVDQAKKAER